MPEFSAAAGAGEKEQGGAEAELGVPSGDKGNSGVTLLGIRGKDLQTDSLF